MTSATVMWNWPRYSSVPEFHLLKADWKESVRWLTEGESGHHPEFFWRMLDTV